MSVHELIWGYTGMALAIIGSIGLILSLIKQIKLILYSRVYLYKVKKLNLEDEKYMTKFNKLTNDYIYKVISIKTTTVFKNPFNKDGEAVLWALYNMQINVGQQSNAIKNIQEKENK